MGLASLVKSVAAAAQNIVGGADGFLVNSRVTYGGASTYDPTSGGYIRTGGSVLTVQALRYKEKYNQTTGLRVNHHPTDGIVAVTEMILFWTKDFPAATLLQRNDQIEILDVSGAVLETWQINTIESDPVRAIVIASLERS